MTLPITDPVLIFALAMVLFLAVPLLFERLRIPGVVGLIIAGAVVGPNGLNLLARGSTIILLGTVGLLFLMFMVGLELDLNEFNRHRQQSVVFGVLSFLLPQAIGTALTLALGYGLLPALLLGAMFASHTLVAYPIATRLGIVKTTPVTIVAGATLITDLLALLVLAIVTGANEGGLTAALWAKVGLSLAFYVALVMLGVPRIGRWFFRRSPPGGASEFLFTLALLYVFAYVAHALDIEPIIGALLLGFALNRLVPESSTLMTRLKFFGDSLVIPFFLLSVGMLVDVRAFADREAWTIIAVLVSATVVSKAIAAKASSRFFGLPSEEGWVMFGLSVSHAAATMAITLVGFQIGLFDEEIVNAVVVIILVTCVLGPTMVERYGRKLALREEQKPYDPSEAPQRILIPISNPKTAEALMGLAFMLRGANSEEPLYPITVVRESGEMAAAQVAEAEKMLSSAVIYAAGANVPVVPLTRVDSNFASGIVRGIQETRTTAVVIGWDGRRSRRYGIFGSVLDQLLEQTKQMILVAKLGHPVNVTKRIVLVLPPEINHHPGFYGAVHTAKTLASQLGAGMLALTIDGDPTRYEKLLGVVRPRVPVTVEAVGGWDGLMAELRTRLRPDDLVVVFSARRGTIGWHRELERMPAVLAQLVPESFIVLYPAEVDVGLRHRALDVLPAALAPERIVFDVANVDFAETLRLLLQTRYADRPAQLQQVIDALGQGGRTIFTEIHPGVVVLHARLERLSEPLIFLATSPEGIAIPNRAEPAKLMFLLLSPVERPERHLVALAEIAHLVGTPERMEEILSSHTLDQLLARLEGAEPPSTAAAGS
jgi:Kef-type K+ transport system membrane component KefB/mannitol/fructose-specific phosphotransferase system IIA component (Ntr-type)/nucleotide-binding universal stress UspA family protein